MKLIAMRDGKEMYEVGRTGQHGVNYPWIGKTHSPCSFNPEAGEIAAAYVWEDCGAVRWAVKSVQD